ncbi:hypothetical protein TNCV_3422081 [Trichonephila clavipes]|nr:hypothetical protein TNCV_3422081 [Trichonephila clavipes]
MATGSFMSPNYPSSQSEVLRDHYNVVTNETTQLVSRNETTQLCTAVDRLQRLQPPTTACNRLQPPTTTCNRLQPPATACTAFTAESAFSTYLYIYI